MIKTNKVFEDFFASFDKVWIKFLHSCRTAPFMMSKRITGPENRHSLVMLSFVATKAISGPERHI